jgi:F0F1-type ATP synthase assembly protein I
VNWDKELMRKLAITLAGATEVTVYSISGFLIGRFVDLKLLGTDPWLTTVFTLAGLAGGFVRLYKIYKKELS